MSLVAPLSTATLGGRPSGVHLALQHTSCCFPSVPERASGSRDRGGFCGRPRGPAIPLCSPAPPSARSDPDNVVLCLLAADEDDDRDVALQIHFTLIQAFCCENDINIMRVSNPGRLAELLLLETDASPSASEGAEQPPDLHCVLVTVRKETDGRPAGPSVGVF